MTSQTTASFWTEVANIRTRWNILEHPFYVRWSAGELSAEELAEYAAQYDQLVVALADASRSAAEKSDGELGAQLERHAAEEADHVTLWRQFADGAGSDVAGAEALTATRGAAEVWAGSETRPLELDLITLYAIEGPQPEIATTKLEGLLAHYGFQEGPATEYFRLHAKVDVEHAALAKSALEELLGQADHDQLLAQAEAVHRAYWEMLDGLMETPAA